MATGSNNQFKLTASEMLAWKHGTLAEYASALEKVNKLRKKVRCLSEEKLDLEDMRSVFSYGSSKYTKLTLEINSATNKLNEAEMALSEAETELSKFIR